MTSQHTKFEFEKKNFVECEDSPNYNSAYSQQLHIDATPSPRIRVSKKKNHFLLGLTN